MIGADSVEGAELVTGPLLVTLERPGVGTIGGDNAALDHLAHHDRARVRGGWLALSW